jgi:hypothetical protein
VAIDLHGVELEQQIAGQTLKTLGAFRAASERLQADLDRWAWLGAFPADDPRQISLPVDPADLRDLEQELRARVLKLPGPKPKLASVSG